MNERSVDGRSLEVASTWITVRGASDRDPGEIAVIHFIVVGRVLALTDAQGQPCKDRSGTAFRTEVGPGEDAAILARRLARRRLREDRWSRNPPSFYTPVVVI